VNELFPLSVCGILRRGNTFLAAKRAPGGDLGGKWEFPGGKAEEGESPQDALSREFHEELNLSITVGESLGEGGFFHKGVWIRLLAFQVEAQGEPVLGPDHSETLWANWNVLNSLDLAPSDMQVLEWIASNLGIVDYAKTP